MNARKLLHPLINLIHEVLHQVNHEEYSQVLITDNLSYRILLQGDIKFDNIVSA